MVMWAVIHVAISASEGRGLVVPALDLLGNQIAALASYHIAQGQPRAAALCSAPPARAARALLQTEHCKLLRALACSTRSRHSQRRSVTLAFQVSGRKASDLAFGGLLHTRGLFHKSFASRGRSCACPILGNHKGCPLRRQPTARPCDWQCICETDI